MSTLTSLLQYLSCLDLVFIINKKLTADTIQ